MNYKSLHDYIRDTATGLGFDVSFFHARRSVTQQMVDTKSVLILMDPMIASGSFYANGNGLSKTYTVDIWVAMQDKSDSAINRNKTSNTDTSKEMDILGQTSTIAGQLIRKLNDNDINLDLQKSSDLLTINQFNEDIAIKEGSHLLTGIVLNMSITVPDNFDYCC